MSGCCEKEDVLQIRAACAQRLEELMCPHVCNINVDAMHMLGSPHSMLEDAQRLR